MTLKTLTKQQHFCPHGVEISECCPEHSIDCIDQDEFLVNPNQDADLPTRADIINAIDRKYPQF